jgi:hypothetical protein
MRGQLLVLFVVVVVVVVLLLLTPLFPSFSSSLTITPATSSCAFFALCLCVSMDVCFFVFMDGSSVIVVQE